MTVLVSTHQLSVAEEMADRIGIIHNGRLIAVGNRMNFAAKAAVRPARRNFPVADSGRKIKSNFGLGILLLSDSRFSISQDSYSFAKSF